MADHNKPSLTDLYSAWPALLKARSDDAVTWLHGITATNLPVNAKRWDTASSTLQNWNGTAWTTLNLGELTIYNSMSDGSKGLKINNFKPSIDLIDRSLTATSFRLSGDNSILRIEADNKDGGVTWQSPKFWLDWEGRLAIGGGGASAAVGLYIRPLVLTTSYQYGALSAPVISGAAAEGISVATGTVLADDVVLLPTLRGFSSNASSLKTIAGGHTHDQAVSLLAHFSAGETTALGYADIRGFYSVINKTAGVARWAAYFSGSAPSYMNGNLLLGSTTDNAVDRLQVNGSVNASAAGYKIAGTKVIGAQDTGWTVAAGAVVANKGAYAPAIIPVAVAAPTKAEFDAAVGAVNLANGRIKAIELALRTHGLIN